MADKKIGDLHDPRQQKARSEFMYEWIAVYNDGTELKQFDDDLWRVHHFGHIDQEKVVALNLVSKHNPPIKISIDLLTGLFSFNGKVIPDTPTGTTIAPLGRDLRDKTVKSSWGNKAKLIYVSHVKRDFNFGNGTMTTTRLYELGWEAEVDGEHMKHTIVIDGRGRIAIPPDEYAGFEPL